MPRHRRRSAPKRCVDENNPCLFEVAYGSATGDRCRCNELVPVTPCHVDAHIDQRPLQPPPTELEVKKSMVRAMSSSLSPRSVHIRRLMYRCEPSETRSLRRMPRWSPRDCPVRASIERGDLLRRLRNGRASTAMWCPSRPSSVPQPSRLRTRFPKSNHRSASLCPRHSCGATRPAATLDVAGSQRVTIPALCAQLPARECAPASRRSGAVQSRNAREPNAHSLVAFTSLVQGRVPMR